MCFLFHLHPVKNNISSIERTRLDYNRRNKMGAGILFEKDGKVLLLKRARLGDKWQGYWNCPGGSREDGETRYETALRESREEVGSLPPFKIYDQIETRAYTLFLAESDYIFTPKLNEEHSKWKWVKRNDIYSYQLHPKDRAPLSIYLRAREDKPALPPRPIAPPKT
jgi:8-oxo-dGTP pyrophosphatase MutT (NUDIX family)